MTKIKLLKHMHYGRERLYPGCQLTKAICIVAGNKTIGRDDLDILLRIGMCKVDIETVKERPVQDGVPHD